MTVYVILYTPIANTYSSVEANSSASGGFGPNQVATVLGFACFCSFILFLFFAKNTLQQIVLISFMFLCFYRCILTFSRGGLYTALAMIFVFLIYTYFKVGIKAKFKIQTIAFVMILSGIGVFSYSVVTTSGFIINRYQNKNGAGKEKLDKFSGRQQIAESEIEIFFKNPVFGCGIGLNREAKAEIGATVIDAHNEITRLLAEQGIFGIIIFILLLFIPLINFLWNREQIFALSFFVFWLLTISHSAMRIAAPAFVYALSLIKINFNDQSSISRK
jgi:O-antigen ligase